MNHTMIKEYCITFWNLHKVAILGGILVGSLITSIAYELIQ